MIRLHIAVAAVAGLVSLPAHTAQLCEGPCSISMTFDQGSMALGSAGATITFGSGGQLVLGTNGVIEPGEGGSVTPDPGADGTPDMSNGGSIVLAHDGYIQFGPGGSLKTGPQGALTTPAGGDFGFSVPASFRIDAQGSVHLGKVWDYTTATLRAGGTITAGDTSTPIHLILDRFAPATIEVNSAAPITYEELQHNPNATGGAQATEERNLCSGGSGSVTIGDGGTTCANGSTGSIDGPQLSEGGLSLETVGGNAGGVLDPMVLLMLLVLLRLGRRGRPAGG